MSDNLISIIKDRSCDIPEVLAERYLIKKYNFAIGNLAIIDVKGFLDFIKKEYKIKDYGATIIKMAEIVKKQSQN